MRTPKRKPSAVPALPGTPPESALPDAGESGTVRPNPAGLHISLTPAAQARLGEAGQPRPASAAEAGLPGWQSLGKDHKPTRANSSRRGPRERKVRW